jgi:hypothetical protein
MQTKEDGTSHLMRLAFSEIGSQIPVLWHRIMDPLRLSDSERSALVLNVEAHVDAFGDTKWKSCGSDRAGSVSEISYDSAHHACGDGMPPHSANVASIDIDFSAVNSIPLDTSRRKRKGSIHGSPERRASKAKKAPPPPLQLHHRKSEVDRMQLVSADGTRSEDDPSPSLRTLQSGETPMAETSQSHDLLAVDAFLNGIFEELQTMETGKPKAPEEQGVPVARTALPPQEDVFAETARGSRYRKADDHSPSIRWPQVSKEDVIRNRRRSSQTGQTGRKRERSPSPSRKLATQPYPTTAHRGFNPYAVYDLENAGQIKRRLMALAHSDSQLLDERPLRSELPRMSETKSLLVFSIGRDLSESPQ